jgi:hypothetical protein
MISGYTTPPRRGPSAIAYLATAALLVLTLVGGLMAFSGSLRLPGSDQRPLMIPAINSAPDNMRRAGVITDVILVRRTLEQMPSSAQARQLALERYQLAPGSVQPVGRQADTGVGLTLFTVETGRVTVEADAPVLVTRADANQVSAPDFVPPGTTMVLDIGDQLYAPSGVSFHRRNDGPTPATVLDLSIGSVGDIVRTMALPAGVTYDSGIPSKLLASVPAAPAEATVRRLTLAPGAELPVRELPGLELVYVESGTLDLVFAKGGTLTTPERVRTIRAGAGLETLGRTPDRAVLANNGAEPLVILTASVVPGGASEEAPQEP